LPTFEEQLNEDMMSFFEGIRERKSRQPERVIEPPRIVESIVTLEESQDNIDPQELVLEVQE